MSDSDEGEATTSRTKRTAKPSRKTLPQSEDEAPKPKKKSTSAKGQPKPKTPKTSTTTSSSTNPKPSKKSTTTSKAPNPAATKPSKGSKGKQKAMEVDTEPEPAATSAAEDDTEKDDAEEQFVEDVERLKRREAKVLLSKQKVQAAIKISGEITTLGIAKGFAVPTEWINDELELKTDLEILGESLVGNEANRY